MGDPEIRQLVGVAVVVCVVAPLAYRQRLMGKTQLVIKHVAERLNEQLLHPLEERAFRRGTDAEGQPSVTLDANSFRCLIEWVRQARTLLDALDTDSWGHPFKDEDVREDLGTVANREFFRRHQEEVGYYEVAFEPFKIWVRELTECVSDGVNLDDIAEVQICGHREIAFKTANELWSSKRDGIVRTVHVSRDGSLRHLTEGRSGHCEFSEDRVRRTTRSLSGHTAL